MKILSFVIALCLCQISLAQLSDGMYANAGMLSGGNVADISKVNAGANIPLFKNDNNSFSVGFDYQLINFDYVDEDVPYATDQIEEFYTFGPSLKYARAFGNQWNFIVKAGGMISSNYKTDNLDDSYFYNGTIVVRKVDTTANATITFGATYNPQYGLSSPIPVITYAKKVNEKMSYQIGVPQMYFRYHVGKVHTFSAFAKLDGFMGTFNDDLEIKTENFEDTGILRQTTVLAGLGYNLKLWKNGSATLKAGKTLYNNMSIWDMDQNEVYDFDIDNSFYINVGINWNIPNKLLD
ncbi:hypothetical protein NBRC110019_10420 [Neptunitalea chrysea]|uniref:DUF6268 domain-containing protein n=1 Tax=Neptunitalea chrysea TaxID=1647581 RepID=A0A9W6B781_9FLAO|nr:DUF6268 family outer membrane beta-barrel protein [Neptunitalea chrysea]GLB52003.1 hypothetical protein NBRC110019_10420 [Neptunitalea chrysea]